LETRFVFGTVTVLIFSEASQVKLCFALPFITGYYDCEDKKSAVLGKSKMNFPEKLKKMEMFVEPNWRQKSSI